MSSIRLPENKYKRDQKKENQRKSELERNKERDNIKKKIIIKVEYCLFLNNLNRIYIIYFKAEILLMLRWAQEIRLSRGDRRH